MTAKPKVHALREGITKSVGVKGFFEESPVEKY